MSEKLYGICENKCKREINKIQFNDDVIINSQNEGDGTAYVHFEAVDKVVYVHAMLSINVEKTSADFSTNIDFPIWAKPRWLGRKVMTATHIPVGDLTGKIEVYSNSIGRCVINASVKRTFNLSTFQTVELTGCYIADGE